MFKILLNLPLHLFNTYIATLAPNWVFKTIYVPSSESIREQEQAIRNKVRLAEWHARKMMQ